MSPLYKCLRLQTAYALSLICLVVGASLMTMLLASLCVPSVAQTYTQGLPLAGNGSTTAQSSQMVIDATQFSGGDMCAKIIAACGFLGSSGYPLGAPL